MGIRQLSEKKPPVGDMKEKESLLNTKEAKKPPVPKRLIKKAPVNKKPIDNQTKSEVKPDPKKSAKAMESGKGDDYKSNLPLTAFNLCNSILGAGIIGKLLLTVSLAPV